LTYFLNMVYLLTFFHEGVYYQVDYRVRFQQPEPNLIVCVQLSRRKIMKKSMFALIAFAIAVVSVVQADTTNIITVSTNIGLHTSFTGGGFTNGTNFLVMSFSFDPSTVSNTNFQASSDLSAGEIAWRYMRANEKVHSPTQTSQNGVTTVSYYPALNQKQLFFRATGQISVVITQVIVTADAPLTQNVVCDDQSYMTNGLADAGLE